EAKASKMGRVIDSTGREFKMRLGKSCKRPAAIETGAPAPLHAGIADSFRFCLPEHREDGLRTARRGRMRPTAR
ncbi:hypothetical protein, partial [Mesorhizobium sp. M4B.F.Ca.ET.200.01.1.1]|uniref:hypothetical protein n=1 Tax=Mesorhizobium sp. M4B.F.Ca.ET.200.01.1.1 TaxID=2563952 RepID=UPI001AEE6253